MSGQADLDVIANRATETLNIARRSFKEGEDVAPATALCLLAIAEHLALANALTMIRLAREAGES